MLFAFGFGAYGSYYDNSLPGELLPSFIIDVPSDKISFAIPEALSYMARVMGFSSSEEYINSYPGLVKIVDQYRGSKIRLEPNHRYFYFRICDDFCTGIIVDPNKREYDVYLGGTHEEIINNLKRFTSGAAKDNLLISTTTISKIKQYSIFKDLSNKDLWFCEDWKDNLT